MVFYMRNRMSLIMLGLYMFLSKKGKVVILIRDTDIARRMIYFQ